MNVALCVYNDVIIISIYRCVSLSVVTYV